MALLGAAVIDDVLVVALLLAFIALAAGGGMLGSAALRLARMVGTLEVMKERVVSIGADETLESAMRLFVAERIGVLPVVDDQQRLVGVLGLDEVLALALPALSPV